MLGKFAGQVHGAKGMLETAVFSRRINPTRTLQLINIAETLHPGRVDQRFFGNLSLPFRYGKLNIAVNRVGDQRRPLVFGIIHWNHDTFSVTADSGKPRRIPSLVRLQKSNARSTDY